MHLLAQVLRFTIGGFFIDSRWVYCLTSWGLVDCFSVGSCRVQGIRNLEALSTAIAGSFYVLWVLSLLTGIVSYIVKVLHIALPVNLHKVAFVKPPGRQFSINKGNTTHSRFLICDCNKQ